MVKSLWAVISRSRDRGVRVGLAFAAAIVLGLGTSTFAGDGTITLKLDDGPAARTPAESTIQVPATKALPAPDPTIGAASAVLMDADTGQLLYTKNPHVKRPNASTTKIMTAILIIENRGMNDIITASKKASETPFTSLNLKPGEKITVKDLLTGMLLRSANDAAVAAAEQIAGTLPKFAEMMNRKAAQIGCTDTHFVTPNGLYDPNHYSSAYDLCLMAKYALKYPVFNEAVNTRKYTLASRTINKKDLVVFCKSKFLKDYPGADGVKSGYTKQAGYCFVGSATRDGWRLVSAVLKSENSGNDTAALMDYGFDNFQPVDVARVDSDRVNVEVNGGSKGSIEAVPARDLRVVVPRTGATVTKRIELKEITAPVAKGTPLGTLYVSVDGTTVAQVELRAAENVDVSIARRAWSVVRTYGLLAACLAVGGRFGAALTKGTRRRGRRLSSILRGYNHRR